MYWIPRIHKNPTGTRFIIASRKQISKSISTVFMLVYSQIEYFHKNVKFLSNHYKFWVLQNSESTILNSEPTK